MSKLHDIQHFMDELRDIRTPKALEQLTLSVARDMGFDIITFFQHVDLSKISQTLDHMRRGDLVGVTTAPLSWVEHYRDKELVAIDPRVFATRRTLSPFTTQDIGKIIVVSAAQRALIESQARHNLGEGFTIPVHFPGEPSGSFTYSMRWGRHLPTHNFAMAHLIANCAFQAGRNIVSRARNRGRYTEPPRLTDRQLQCTVLVGRGLSEAAIAGRLGVSSETVKRHLKEARRTFGVAKSVQLVIESLHAGHITLRDLLAERAW